MSEHATMIPEIQLATERVDGMYLCLAFPFIPLLPTCLTNLEMIICNFELLLF